MQHDPTPPAEDAVPAYDPATQQATINHLKALAAAADAALLSDAAPVLAAWRDAYNGLLVATQAAAGKITPGEQSALGVMFTNGAAATAAQLAGQLSLSWEA